MNNIEINELKKDIKKYFGCEIGNIGMMSDDKFHAIKKYIKKRKEIKGKTTKDKYQINIIQRNMDKFLSSNPKFIKKHPKLTTPDPDIVDDLPPKSAPNPNPNSILGIEHIIKKNKKPKQSIKEKNKSEESIIKPKLTKLSKPKPVVVSKAPEMHKPYWVNEGKLRKVSANRSKPKILFISDVKGWAWWIKSQYIKKYLSDYYDIDIICLLGPDKTPANRVDQKNYDLYFTFGFSYIDMLYKVPKYKKITGVTAHRRKNVIFPKMKMAGNHHANSIMLLKEMRNMGFKRCFYVPNGVDEKLFRPINPIREIDDIVVGHVGKECMAKGQRECIFPAINKTGVKSYTNTRNWKDKISHNQMPYEYAKMDLFLVSSKEDGTPNPGLESAACGRPIISNRIGNMPELITDNYNGFIIPRKKQAYVEKINYFKIHRNELIRMGNNARKEIEEGWTWELMSRNYLKMFDTIFGIKRDFSKYDSPSLRHLEKL